MKTLLSVIALAVLALLLGGCGASAPRLTDAGNQAFAQQSYDQALQAYGEAQAKSPDLAEPYYNAANALYREGKYQEALAQLEKALQASAGAALAQNIHFNAGNAAFSGEQWEAAVADYTEALLRDPNDQDAKVNLELALQKLSEQQNQEQQNQDQQNQDQQSQDQQSQDQQNQDQQNQDQQNQDQQNQDQQNQDQQSEDQQSQQDGQEQQDQGQQGQNPQDQSQPGSQQDGQSAGQQDENTQQPREGMQLAPGQRMTQDQARQLLAAVARNSDTLQQRLGQFLRVRGRPPVQDW